ncbi:UDP-N-acetylglucosamine 4,6-dehydratase (inverting) [Oceanirhabdus sp. W0125-5]|uniref:UDP-N-acetylglucosamine 4,6-dehydratase (inverting) n=1 Tax=Oceanirhabdus sp. W0125-5 TaxID=2999116 RepID=UPI0022F2C04F|nr:UDP-N-acetylglucosamine 4,6-dehydratase (inverting) [Oceanirhabdus sp. W0125-5]WBW96211.1 UDP-N-acetylglucosamine 4,6-dehydratase (inverting) [Oceanirhabdus sp. W0125-5]
MFNEKVILITGGTGSFGQNFTKRLLKTYNPKKIIIFSRDEYKQDLFRKYLTINMKDKVSKVRFFIGDVRDKSRLLRAFDGVDYVIHAAAMKQVPACEYNPIEAIKTNVYGAENIIDAALDRGVKKVIALSTDKAVNPVNLYGGTKLVSDKLFISANAYSRPTKTIFSIVRYGNVSGSRGSVIPYFKNLITQGYTELPITDYEMTRFWISLDEGIDLVIKAIKESVGGEIYISKIPSFKIVDLAYAMLPNATTKEVGIREGEKLHEVMISKEDSRYTYEYDNYYIIYPNFDWLDISKYSKEGGVPLPYGFEYSSGNNKHWLNVEDLQKELHSLNLL